MTILIQIIIGLVILGILVVIHELGHFLMAKAWHIRVLAFSIGFGKPLFKKNIGETEYRISSIPFGGYVHMAGEQPEEGKTVEPGDFNSKPTWQRALVALAGPLANFIFALVFLVVMFLVGVDKPVFLKRPIIGAVSDSSVAKQAGFFPGDSIIAINNHPIESWEDIQTILGSRSAVYKVVLIRTSRKDSINLVMPRIYGRDIPKQPAGGLLPPYPAVVGSVTAGSPAHKAGLRINDVIVSINDGKIYSWPQLSAIILHYDSLAGPFKFVVRRADSLVNTTIAPEYKRDAKRYLIGIAPQNPRTIRVSYPLNEAVLKTFHKSWEYTTMIFDVIGKLISKQVPPQQLAGPVGIVQMSGLVAMGGLSPILDFMALIGINLAVLNVLPLVITDGGLLFFLLIETIRRKPLSVTHQMLINRIAIGFFIFLFLFVTYNDILRIPELFKLAK
ncbi:MAG: RIP metalloprotease RseP [Chitinivibrionales bacterium]